jgi:hypothetical protein
MTRKYTILSFLFVAAYVGSYLALSLGGAYLPAT